MWRSEKKKFYIMLETKTHDFNDEKGVFSWYYCPCIPVGNILHFADPKAGSICSNVNMVIK